MSLRCAVCGSKRVTTEIKKEGYNTKKGILGGILFGTTGSIIGGSSGVEVTYYHCADCGHTINKCMYDWEANDIDVAINNKDTLLYKKILREKKKKYPNIEWNEETGTTKTDDKQFLESRPEEEKLDITVKKSDFLEEMIFDAIKQSKTSVSVEQLKNIEEFSEYTNQKLASVLNKMAEKKFLDSEIRNHRKGYFVLPDAKKLTKEDFPTIEKNKEELSTELQNLASKIIELMKDGKERRITEIPKYFPNYSQQTICVILNRLTTEGHLKKTSIDNKVYYKYKA